MCFSRSTINTNQEIFDRTKFAGSPGSFFARAYSPRLQSATNVHDVTMTGSWQEYVAKDLSVGEDLEDDEAGAPMVGLFPGSTFVANTRITRRWVGVTCPPKTVGIIMFFSSLLSTGNRCDEQIRDLFIGHIAGVGVGTPVSLLSCLTILRCAAYWIL